MAAKVRPTTAMVAMTINISLLFNNVSVPYVSRYFSLLPQSSQLHRQLFAKMTIFQYGKLRGRQESGYAATARYVA